MRSALPWVALIAASCSQEQTGVEPPKKISCGFKNVGSLIVEAGVKSSFSVPPEARDPVSFELEGQISGDRFAGKLTNFRRPGSDLIYQEEVQGGFDRATGSITFRAKDSFAFSVWVHRDPPDQEGSRATFLGEMNGLETASLFVGACGTG